MSSESDKGIERALCAPSVYKNSEKVTNGKRYTQNISSACEQLGANPMDGINAFDSLLVLRVEFDWFTICGRYCRASLGIDRCGEESDGLMYLTF